MSIDLQVVPTLAGDVKISKLVEVAPSQLGHLTFRKLGEERPMDSWSCLEKDHAYQVSIINPANIIIYVDRIDEDDPGYEEAMVSDYGRNLTESKKEEIVNLWRVLGYYFIISSTATRTLDEMEVQKDIAAGIATLTNGFVIVKNNGIYSLDVGLYTGVEFRACNVVPVA